MKVQRVHLRIPASTSNLGPGFDCIGLALALYNEFQFERLPRTEVEIILGGEGAESLPADPSNRAYQAFLFTCRAIGIEPPGVRILQHNHIPLARGLGGSGTAVLAGVIAALLFSGEDPAPQRVLDLAFALEQHPDNITPSLVGGLTISHVADGHVYYVKIDPPAGIVGVVLIPEQGMDTALARAVLPQSYTREDVIFSIRGASMLVAALATGQMEHLALAMQDRLHQPQRTALIPAMPAVFEAALAAGALGVALSGAGSGIFALADEEAAQRVATAMEERAEQLGWPARARILVLEHSGTRIVQAV